MNELVITKVPLDTEQVNIECDFEDKELLIDSLKNHNNEHLKLESDNENDNEDESHSAEHEEKSKESKIDELFGKSREIKKEESKTKDNNSKARTSKTKLRKKLEKNNISKILILDDEEVTSEVTLDNLVNDEDKEEEVKEDVKEDISLRKVKSDVRKQSKKKPVDVTHNMDAAIDEEKVKNELLMKFVFLKRSDPSIDIPEFTINSNLASMQRTYDNTVRGLSFDSSITNFKTYLSYGFMITEFLLGKFAGLDMEGFCESQLNNMNAYDKLLIEIGEKNYVSKKSNLPVEIRLIFLILFNTFIFVISKFITKKTGTDLMSMLGQITKKSGGKSKMKGPTIDLSKI